MVGYAGREDRAELAVEAVFGGVHHAVVGWLEVGVEGLEALARSVDGQLQAETCDGGGHEVKEVDL